MPGSGDEAGNSPTLEIRAAVDPGVDDLGHPLIDRVRGHGLLLGVVLQQPVAAAVASVALDAGFIVNAPTPDVIRLAPPLVLTTEQADRFVTALPTILDTASKDAHHAAP